VARAFGFGQGFDDFVRLPRRRERSAFVTAEALAWLDARRWRGEAAPFFLYLHTADPHAGYEPPPEFRARFAAHVPRDGTGTRYWLRRVDAGEIPVTAALLDHVGALYDAEVAANDASFGALVAGLRRRGLWDDTAVVVVSDHGEEFHEHGGWDHGKTLHTEVLDVPLLARFPGLPRGRRVGALAQHIDVLPTLLAYLGLPLPRQVEGRNLLPLLAAAPGPAGADGKAADAADAEETAAFSYLDLDGRRGAAVTSAGWRYLDLRAPAPARALYDRAADPAERASRLADRPVRAGYLRARLRARELARRGALGPEPAVIDEELRRDLRALGYLD
jgi:arylsulfatase A-like enzyme